MRMNLRWVLKLFSHLKNSYLSEGSPFSIKKKKVHYSFLTNPFEEHETRWPSILWAIVFRSNYCVSCKSLRVVFVLWKNTQTLAKTIKFALIIPKKWILSWQRILEFVPHDVSIDSHHGCWSWLLNWILFEICASHIAKLRRKDSINSLFILKSSTLSEINSIAVIEFSSTVKTRIIGIHIQ